MQRGQLPVTLNASISERNVLKNTRVLFLIERVTTRGPFSGTLMQPLQPAGRRLKKRAGIQRLHALSKILSVLLGAQE